MFTIRDVRKNAEDSSGALITDVYAKVDNAYALYRTEDRVLVQFADDAALGADQRKLLAPLGPVRGEINGLIDGWRKTGGRGSGISSWFRHDKVAKAALFDRRVADALAIALQGSAGEAATILAAVKADIVEERTALARTEHVIVAGMIAALLIALIAAVTAWAGPQVPSPSAELPLARISFDAAGFAAAMGISGAFFSIALAVRAREAVTDLQTKDNVTDAAMRVMIGGIAAFILYCLVGAQYFTFGFGDSTAPQLAAWQPGLAVLAFAAGFSERLVGNVLGRAAVGKGSAAANPVTAGAPAAATAPRAPAGAANERNPLGRTADAPDGGAAPAAPVPAAINDDEETSEGGHDHGDASEADLTDDIELPEAVGGVERIN